MSATDGSPGRHESTEERADRNWDELLQELRVTQTGTQILTGFLLTLPFQQRFTDLRSDQVVIYLCLVCLGLATTAFAVAPVSIHRMLFQRRRKPEIVRMANGIARFALATLGLLVAGIVLFVFDVVVGRGAAMVAAGAAALLAAVLWLALPLRLRGRGG
ncbi:DUF6328 family protein [Ruania alba]|uniref:Sodium:proton antiporter n=1 Tax=Ruania alba TaxID=648782 RepID=A0A1H5GPP5_9MICO|nr:DUF6328 family protein [Ruania alba]SEE17454.1 hypothetical protein SAMN04488554_1714 [Ruania alba]